MFMPNRDKASVSTRKLVFYLVSESHAVGKSKATFFGIMGYDKNNVDLL